MLNIDILNEVNKAQLEALYPLIIPINLFFGFLLPFTYYYCF